MMRIPQVSVTQTTEDVTKSMCTRQPARRYRVCVPSVMYGTQMTHVVKVSLSYQHFKLFTCYFNEVLKQTIQNRHLLLPLTMLIVSFYRG